MQSASICVIIIVGQVVISYHDDVIKTPPFVSLCDAVAHRSAGSLMRQ